MNDAFDNSTDSPTAPSENCFAITPSDAADLPQATKAIYVGTGGDVMLRSVRGAAAVRFRNVPAGAIIDVRTAAFLATGTTAADIVGLA